MTVMFPLIEYLRQMLYEMYIIFWLSVISYTGFGTLVSEEPLKTPSEPLCTKKKRKTKTRSSCTIPISTITGRESGITKPFTPVLFSFVSIFDLSSVIQRNHYLYVLSLPKWSISSVVFVPVPLYILLYYKIYFTFYTSPQLPYLPFNPSPIHIF